jgi:DNA polymerase-1
MNDPLAHFRSLWLVDFEYYRPEGQRDPHPHCVVAHDIVRGHTISTWLGEEPPPQPPYGVGQRDLFICFQATAEMSCHLTLGWPVPVNILDLATILRWHMSGVPNCYKGNPSLANALQKFGITMISKEHKADMRQLAQRGTQFTDEEKTALLEYCAEDVFPMQRLLTRMLEVCRPSIPHQLYFGQVMASYAKVEQAGVPIEVDLLKRIQTHKSEILAGEISRVERALNCPLFKRQHLAPDKVAAMAKGRGYKDWPLTPTGRHKTDSDTLREKAKAHPELMDLKEVQTTIGQQRLLSLPCGDDGMNRYYPFPMSSKTGRSQPSSSRSVFAAATWLRWLIVPKSGQVFVGLDYSAQEFCIAAFASRDPVMIKFATGEEDPHLAFGKHIGEIPKHATKHSHSTLRGIFKIANLGILMGMGGHSLAAHVNAALPAGRSPWSQHDGDKFIQLHQVVFQVFWAWRGRVCRHATSGFPLQSVLGWQIREPLIGMDSDEYNDRSYSNFPLQSGGAAILWQAMRNLHKHDYTIAATLHDGIYLTIPAEELEERVPHAIWLMEESARQLYGRRIKVEAEIALPGQRYGDKRGRETFKSICKSLQAIDGREIRNIPE